MSQVYRVLARKYRPVALSDLLGQDLLVQALSQAIQHNRLPHAFLLHGIRGVGKTTTARIIARVINCLNNDTQTGKRVEACGACSSCISLKEDRHLDVIEIDAASRTGVDDIREIIESCRYRPVAGRYKVFIVDEVHMISKSAFNALLKTLEEPPPHVKFIFATTEIRKIPETILSRCMRFDLKRIEIKLLMTHLTEIAEREGYGLEPEGAAALARAADGSMRDGLSLLDQALVLNYNESPTADLHLISTSKIYDMLGLADRQRIFELIKVLLEGKVDSTLQNARGLFQDGSDSQLLLQDILDSVYGLICLKTVPHSMSQMMWSQPDLEFGLHIVQSVNISILLSVWQALLSSYEEVCKAPVPYQALELALMRICYLADLPPLETLMSALKNQEDKGIRQHAVSSSLSNPLHQLSAPASTMISPVSSAESNQRNSREIPKTFKELMEQISKAREPIIYTHLLQDVECIQYRPGEMTLYLSPSIPESFVAILKKILKTLTGIEWVVKLAAQPSQGSIKDQQQKKDQADRALALKDPRVQAIERAFPGAKAQIIDPSS